MTTTLTALRPPGRSSAPCASSRTFSFASVILGASAASTYLSTSGGPRSRSSRLSPAKAVLTVFGDDGIELSAVFGGTFARGALGVAGAAPGTCRAAGGGLDDEGVALVFFLGVDMPVHEVIDQNVIGTKNGSKGTERYNKLLDNI